MTASGEKQQRNEVPPTTGRDDVRGGANEEQNSGNPDVVQGEGDYDSAREFNAAEQEFVASGKVPAAARAAAPTSEAEQAEMLEAEQKGKQRAKR
jgi:hypothetical protein